MHLLWNIYLFPDFYGEWPLGSGWVEREPACLKSARTL